jgi:hypothetical protein
MTAVASTAFTAAQWNVHGRDNLNAQANSVATTSGSWIVTAGYNSLIERIPAVNYVGTSGATNSTAYTDLQSTGSTLTLNTGAWALVSIGGQMSNNTAGLGSRISVEISGTTTQEAADTNAYAAQSGNVSDVFKGTWTTIMGFTPGSNTLTLKYRSSFGGGTSTFSGRLLMVISF